MKLREKWNDAGNNRQRYSKVVALAAAGAIAMACDGHSEVDGKSDEAPYNDDCHTTWITQGTGDPYTNIKIYPSDLESEQGAENLKGRMQASFMPDRTGGLENRERNVTPEVLDAFVVSVRHVMEASTTDRLPMVTALAYSESGKAHTTVHGDDKLCAVDATKFPISSIYNFESY